LGAESSLVVPNYNGFPVEAIGGGAQRGQNLFHSFNQFNVSAGRGAYFAIQNDVVRNILTRVTGGSRSEVLGTLGTFRLSDGSLRVPGVNLFLINSNGIVFGENASLDVGGSFFATTANAVQLGDAGLFSASQPLSSNLLTINPSAFLFNATALRGSIINRSTAAQTLLGTTTNGLQVLDTKTLALLGGDVTIEGGRVYALSGRVDIGAVAGAGTVRLDSDGNQPKLSFSTEVSRANVALNSQARVDVTGSGGGDIAVYGQNISLTNGSIITSGITQGSSLPGNRSGDITVDATGAIRLSDSSQISNGVLGGIGSSGNVQIYGQTVDLVNGSLIGSFSSGKGNAGNVTIQAKDTISLSGKNQNGVVSGIVSAVGSLSGFSGEGNGGGILLKARTISLQDSAQVGTNNLFAKGNAGNIRVEVANSLFLTDAAGLQTSTSGQGNAGNIFIEAGNIVSLISGASLLSGTLGQGNAGSITVKAGNVVRLDGVGTNGNPSQVESSVGAIATGNGSNIEITTGSLAVANGARLNASTSSKGDAGNIILTVRDAAIFNGVTADLRFSSGAFSTVEQGAIGKGGNVELSAGSLSVTNGAALNSSTFGQGDAGNVRLTINGTATFDGVTPDNRFVSGASSTVNQGAIGKGGNVELSAGSLSVSDGATFTASTSGQGDAGNVRLTINGTATFDGVTPDNRFGSGVSSTVNQGAMGQGGNVELSAGSLSVTNGAVLTASTSGQGDAGNITIEVRDATTLDGVGSNGTSSQVGSQVIASGVGNGGNISLTTGSLTVTNGSALSSGTFGQGDAGNVSITVRDATTLDGVGSNGTSSQVGSQVIASGVGNGGNISLTTGSLTVTNGSALSSGTFGQGDAGNVSITVRDATTFDGVGSNGTSSQVGSQVAASGVGNGGNLSLTTGSLTVTNGGALSSGTFGQGDAGNIVLTVRGVTTFDGVGSNGISSQATSIVEANAVGRGGNLNLTTGSLTVTNGAVLLSSTVGQGSAGNITLAVRDATIFDGQGSNGLYSQAASEVGVNAKGNGGNISLTTGSLTVKNGGVLGSGTFGQGDAGDITLAVRDATTFDGMSNDGEASRAISQVETNAVGEGGNISLTTGSLTVTNGAVLTSSTLGQGNAGNISVDVRNTFQAKDGSITTRSDQFSSGNITISAKHIFLRGNSDITTNSEGGDGGNITLTAKTIVALNDSDILSFANDGRGGNITFNTPAFFGQNYRPGSPPPFDGNNRVDINASGTVSGIITLPDISFLQNSLTEFSQTFTDTTQLLANSCIVRRGQQNGSFTITGSGGLPQRPGDAPVSPFPTGEVRSMPETREGGTGEKEQKDTGHPGLTHHSKLITQNSSDRPWKLGDPIVEPQGVYKLANGELVMSRECSNTAEQNPTSR
jgi:filamentous hemagglutinin family protein